MLAVTEQSLTLAGFIALVSLLLLLAGFVASALSKTSEVRERLAKLEQRVNDHLENGTRHNSERR